MLGGFGQLNHHIIQKSLATVPTFNRIHLMPEGRGDGVGDQM